MAGHIEDAVGLLEVEGEADGVPALAEGEAEFGARRIFENGDAGDVLPEETQAKGDAARHAEAPAKVAGSVFAKIIVKTGISATGRQKNSCHSTLPNEVWKKQSRTRVAGESSTSRRKITTEDTRGNAVGGRPDAGSELRFGARPTLRSGDRNPGERTSAVFDLPEHGVQDRE